MVRVVVLMGGAAARALVACCARVELGARCELGVCHHLGPAGGVMLRWWALGWRAWVLDNLNGADSHLLVRKCAKLMLKIITVPPIDSGDAL